MDQRKRDAIRKARRDGTRRPRHKTRTRCGATLEGKRGPVRHFTAAEIAALNEERRR